VTDALRPRRALASRWSTDPDFATAYSYLRPGGTPADRDLLAAPIAPGLLLAGEATWAEHPGTMHGAWFSGERAARSLDAQQTAHVVVVGAGLAGIAAAQLLRARGTRVTVLEAGGVLGGRAATDRSSGGPVHTGAAWLHGDVGNPIAEAARRVGVTTSPSRWGAMTTFVRGEGLLDDATLMRLDPIRARIEQAVEDAIAEGDERAALGPVLRAQFDALDVGPTDRLVLERWIIGIYENLYAAPIDDLSLVHSAEPFRLPGDDLTILGGLDGVVAELAAGLDVQVRARVRRIEHHGAGWRVHTADVSVDADAVIVTVPLGVLQAGRIAFDPPLPTAVAQALTRLGAGAVAKAFFTFSDAFWSPRWSFATLGAPRPPFELWVDASRLAGQPTLCAFATRDRATEIEQLSEPALIALATQVLGDCCVSF
jgi:polyamine oxidase